MHTQTNFYQNNLKIELKNVSKSFDDKKILDNINLKVYKGEIVSIIGASGCGKSTIFDIISKNKTFDNGEVFVNGKISYMFQKDLLLPYKTIIDNVSLPLVLNKVSKKEAHKKVYPYFEIFKLQGYENKFPHELSGGMKQRASFLRTFINSNDIMLLDEAFSALDFFTKQEIYSWLLDLKKQINYTILFITHDIDEAVNLSDRIYLLSKNKPSTIKKEFVVDKTKDSSNLKNEIFKSL